MLWFAHMKKSEYGLWPNGDRIIETWGGAALAPGYDDERPSAKSHAYSSLHIRVIQRNRKTLLNQRFSPLLIAHLLVLVDEIKTRS